MDKNKQDALRGLYCDDGGKERKKKLMWGGNSRA
jgi:hypothetical protein